jgi:chemotaxis protein histidine kinase CheA
MSAMQLRLNELTERFAGGLPGRIAAISRLLIHVEGEGVASAPAAEIERLLHSLGGAAGTFRFLTVASLAAAREAICVRASGVLDGDDLEHLGSLTCELLIAVTARQR